MNRKIVGVSDEQAEAIIQIMKSQSLPTVDGCIERQKTPNKDGYTNYKLGPKVYGAHRLMYMLCKGLQDPASVVMHTCDNRRCINIEHLREGTYAQNSYDCIVKRRTNWQVNPVEPSPIIPNKNWYSPNMLIDVLKRRLSGQSLSVIAEAVGVTERRAEDWIRDVFGTTNVAIRLDLEFVDAEAVVVKRPVVREAKKADKDVVSVDVARDKSFAKEKKDELKEAVYAMHDIGMNAYEIAREVGKSYHTIRAMLLSKYGKDARVNKGYYSTKHDKKEIARDFWESGSVAAVAQKYEVSPGTVYSAKNLYPKEYFSAPPQVGDFAV